MTTTQKNETQVSLPTDQEILVVHTFDAPRDLVWKMWTEAEHLKHWWGQTGWTLPVCEVDFREGGSWFYCMQGPDGMQSCGKAIYSNIKVPKRFVMKDIFVDADGNPMEGMPEGTSTYEFIEHDGKTTVRSTTVYPTNKDRDAVIEMGMEEGIKQALDRLEAHLAEVG